MRTWLRSAKNPRLPCNLCCKSTSSPWQGHKRAVFSALMVLFPNAINSQEFRVIASTTCRNSAQELHCHLGIPMAVRASGKRARERREHAVTSPPRPFNPGGQLETPQGNPRGDFRVAAEEGALHLSLAFLLHRVERPPRREGKAVGGVQDLQLLPCFRSYSLSTGL